MGLEGDPATGEHFYELVTRTPKPGGKGRQWRGPDWRFLCSGGYLQSCDIDLVDQHFPDQLQLLRAEGLYGAIRRNRRLRESGETDAAFRSHPRDRRVYPATNSRASLTAEAHASTAPRSGRAQASEWRRRRCAGSLPARKWAPSWTGVGKLQQAKRNSDRRPSRKSPHQTRKS